ncbi:hypothetical protein B0H17DRAFT_926941 [Mycena rosella]|uniref:Uncharacterized protein n=1 Tax=Mycena rosella TaxID=1033263 RepID=A0AAD7GQ17_MYCRO|nr:hypothetical protein B0H17DRAFT_926941 [Mycena rosella]
MTQAYPLNSGPTQRCIAVPGLRSNVTDVPEFNSKILAMKNLDYTVINAQDVLEAAQLYRMVPDLVKMVIVNDEVLFACWKDTSQCRRTAQNPSGIPIYKMFSFYFWLFLNHPLGAKWVLLPKPYALEPGANKNIAYLGYSIEHASAFVPVALQLNQAWILAKQLAYLSPSKSLPWTTVDYNVTVTFTGIYYALGAGLGDGEAVAPPGLQVPAVYEKDVFMHRLAQSKVLIGVGNPVVSLTLWDGALCLGVLFLNLLNQWDENDPDDSSKWHGQHMFVPMLGKPYVYNVRQGNHAGFVQAIGEAISHPIGLFVPERMHISAVKQRLEEIVNHNWEIEERRQVKWCHKPCSLSV